MADKKNVKVDPKKAKKEDLQAVFSSVQANLSLNNYGKIWIEAKNVARSFGFFIRDRLHLPKKVV